MLGFSLSPEDRGDKFLPVDFQRLTRHYIPGDRTAPIVLSRITKEHKKFML
jgi:hypothetical protein